MKGRAPHHRGPAFSMAGQASHLRNEVKSLFLFGNANSLDISLTNIYNRMSKAVEERRSRMMKGRPSGHHPE
jgi:hypothetical protein